MPGEPIEGLDATGKETRPSLLWTPRQRTSLCILLLLLCLLLGYRVLRNPAYISDPEPEAGARFAELADRIDPNTADWARLAALPQIGPALARRIVEHREQARLENPGRVPFADLEEMKQVKGIGEATVRTIAPYLIFPSPDRPHPAP